jgi:hypothetical protein
VTKGRPSEDRYVPEPGLDELKSSRDKDRDIIRLISALSMKITYNAYHAVGSWRWDLQPPSEGEGAAKTEPELDDEADSDSEDEEDEDEEEDEVCGICQLEFESSCPGCKVPGDDCPLSEF